MSQSKSPKSNGLSSLRPDFPDWNCNLGSICICIWQKEILGSTCLYDFACLFWCSMFVPYHWDFFFDIWSVRENAQRKNEDLNVGNGRERERDIIREIEKNREMWNMAIEAEENQANHMKETQESIAQRWGVERLLGPPLAEFDVICKMYVWSYFGRRCDQGMR